MIEKIALFDLDGTLCDYEKALVDRMNTLRCPAAEPPLDHWPRFEKLEDAKRAVKGNWGDMYEGNLEYAVSG